jgi:hypothetical protein
LADLTSLIAGGAKSLLKDKASEFMSPQQMELARFALSPQAYLADKGITAVAQLLGYGNEFRELKAGAEGEKAYGKEIIRDTIGNALPNSIGDFVRATPRVSEADSQPAGTYTAFDPETQTYKQQGSANPVAMGNSAAFEDFMRDLNAGDNYPVGPLEEYDQTRLNDEYDFQTSLSDFQQPSESNTRSLSSQPSDTQTPPGYSFDPNTGTMVPDDSGAQAPEGFRFDPDLGMNVPNETPLNAAPEGYTYDANLGMNVPVTESLAPTGYQFDPNTGTAVPIDFGGTMDYGDMFGGGGGGGKLEDAFLQAQEYKRGGQICGCK